MFIKLEASNESRDEIQGLPYGGDEHVRINSCCWHNTNVIDLFCWLRVVVMLQLTDRADGPVHNDLSCDRFLHCWRQTLMSSVPSNVTDGIAAQAFKWRALHGAARWDNDAFVWPVDRRPIFLGGEHHSESRSQARGFLVWHIRLLTIETHPCTHTYLSL